jgi:hypothetical protein
MYSEDSVFTTESTKSLGDEFTIRNLENTGLTHEVSAWKNAIGIEFGMGQL